jgi:hypothetical protein
MEVPGDQLIPVESNLSSSTNEAIFVNLANQKGILLKADR